MEGVNYATGDRVRLTLYRPIVREPSPRREAARPAEEAVVGPVPYLTPDADAAAAGAPELEQTAEPGVAAPQPDADAPAPEPDGPDTPVQSPPVEAPAPDQPDR